ncbi:MAG: glycerol-3-phosphate 1-O-acyltransferase PlsY [Oscillospiraceae bacterium]|jgi:glycerol-3-phosphate acyltransferase PlsY|nr:glycerol-3-phosphate 1-O-acyltransferase PlsY [Oscillospiraceae bacterium]
MVIAYLIGSVNPAILISKTFKKKDIRELGSKNAGATNITRTLGLHLGMIVLLLDASKGVLAIAIGREICKRFCVQPCLHVDYLTLLAALWGHCFPLFFNFKGGKAVATTAGGLLLLNPAIFLMAFSVFIFVVARTQQIGMGAVGAALSLPLDYYLWVFFSGKFDIDFLFIVGIAIILIVAHTKNIKEHAKFLFRGQ